MQDDTHTNNNNKKYNIKLIALDLDGTTFNSKGELTDRTRDALERAAAYGVYIVISTGRSFNSLPESIKTVKGIKYGITSNGAHINEVATGGSIYDSYLSMEALNSVIEFTKKTDVGMEVFIDGQAYLDDETYNEIKEHGTPFRNAEYVLWSRKPCEDIYSLISDNNEKIENINILFNGIEHLERYRETVEAFPCATITSSFINNLEVGGPNTSKKTALEELCQRLKIKPDEVMCCGDAPNDIQMMEFAGLGVAMGNAWGGTKDHADYITETNDEDGVALAIEQFVL